MAEPTRKMITATLQRGPSKMGWTAWFLVDREGRALNTEPVCSTPEDKWHPWFILVLESLTTPYWGRKESPADDEAKVGVLPSSPSALAIAISEEIDSTSNHAEAIDRVIAEYAVADGKWTAKAREKMTDHILVCEKRPEKVLLDLLDSNAATVERFR